MATQRSPIRRRLEGASALGEALDQGLAPRLVLARSGERSPATRALLRRASERGARVLEESPREMTRMSVGTSPPEVIGLIGPPIASGLDELMAVPGLVLALVGLRYPGNVGFILRSAEVAGAAGVVVDAAWSRAEWESALRVGMHADRFMSILREDVAAAVEAARRAGRQLVAVETSGAASPWSVDLARPTMLLLGGEAEGLATDALAAADAIVRIPSGGFIPSYNVQAATSILLGEWLRQTSTDPSGRDASRPN